MKKALVHLQDEADLDTLEGVLKYFSWSKSIRDDIPKVVEQSQRQRRADQTATVS